MNSVSVRQILRKMILQLITKVIQLGAQPVRVDIVTFLTGVSWEEASASKTPGSYGEVSVFFIGRDEFINNKRATGRKRDLADIEALGEK